MQLISKMQSISVNPEQISNILSLCPICYDIQNKILMLYICMNETPLKNLIANMKKNKTIKYAYPEKTLTSYCKDLSLFNHIMWVYPEYKSDEEDDPDDPNPNPISYLPEFIYDFLIAYSLYHFDEYDFINEKKSELNAVTKIRLNQMIEDGKPYNI